MFLAKWFGAAALALLLAISASAQTPGTFLDGQPLCANVPNPNCPGQTTSLNSAFANKVDFPFTSNLLGTPNTWTALQTFNGGIAGGSFALKGVTSGTVTQVPQAVAGTPTVTWGTSTGTPAVTASAPLGITAATGNATCTTCATTTNGGALSGTAPVALSAGGAVSITGAAGQVLAGAGPAFTATPTLGTNGGTGGSLAFNGATSGTVTQVPQAVAGTPTVTWGTNSGTPVVTTSAPLGLSATTGNLAITGAAGQVLAGAGPAFTATPILGTNGGAGGQITLNGATSGASVLSVSAAGTTLNLGSTNATVDTAGITVLNSVTVGNVTGGTATNSAAILRSTSNGAPSGDLALIRAGQIAFQNTSGATTFGQFQASGGLSIGNATDPGTGGLELNGQIFMPNITTTSTAQNGTVCWTTGTGKFTVDTTVGCLTSSERFKNVTGYVGAGDALDIVHKLQPITFTKKTEFGGDLDPAEQYGLSAEQTAQVDERLIGRGADGLPKGVRYQELTAVLVGAIQALQAEVDELKNSLRK